MIKASRCSGEQHFPHAWLSARSIIPCACGFDLQLNIHSAACAGGDKSSHCSLQATPHYILPPNLT